MIGRLMAFHKSILVRPYTQSQRKHMSDLFRQINEKVFHSLLLFLSTFLSFSHLPFLFFSRSCVSSCFCTGMHCWHMRASPFAHIFVLGTSFFVFVCARAL